MIRESSTKCNETNLITFQSCTHKKIGKSPLTDKSTCTMHAEILTKEHTCVALTFQHDMIVVRKDRFTVPGACYFQHTR